VYILQIGKIILVFLILSAHQSFTFAVQSDIKVSPSILVPIERLLVSWFDLRKVRRRFCDAFWSQSYQNIDAFKANLKNKIVCHIWNGFRRFRRIARSRSWDWEAGTSEHIRVTDIDDIRVRCVL